MALGGFSGYCQKNLTINVVSFNVRYNSPDDGINIWENRRDWVAGAMRFYEADLIGGQEVTYAQLVDMQDRLPAFAHVGIGREGGNAGEFSPIFYRKDRFTLLKSDTFWLSETPGKVAVKGWDAALPRIVTWALFKDNESGIEFYHFNTHFDHRGKEARVQSAALIVAKVKAIAAGQPVVLTGDFNSNPESKAYSTITTNGFDDSFTTVEATQSYGPAYTASGWDAVGRDASNRIDYVFLKNGTMPLRYHVLDGQRGNRYISDHFPVMVKVALPHN